MTSRCIGDQSEALPRDLDDEIEKPSEGRSAGYFHSCLQTWLFFGVLTEVLGVVFARAIL